MAMRWVFTGAGPTTGATFPVDLPSNDALLDFQAFVSGTVGGSTPKVQFQYSPDPISLADGSSRWSSPTALAFTTATDALVQFRARKVRAVFTGGDGTTAITAELL